MSGDDPKRYRDQADIDGWNAKDPLIRTRLYLEGKKIWNEKMENEYVAQVDQEIKDAVAQADQAPRQKVSSFLKNMFENPPAVIQEQIALYEAKEAR